jgi:hypothetical protein
MKRSTNEALTNQKRRTIRLQYMQGPEILMLRGQDLRDFIEDLKSRGIINNTQDLRGDAIKAYRADLEERHRRLKMKESIQTLEILERKAVEKIDDSAFSNLMKEVIGKGKLI